MPDDDRFIVAEISKSWQDGQDMPGTPYPGWPLCRIFEEVVRVNLGRGYVLHSFSTRAVLSESKGVLTETVLAVFEKAGG